MKQVLPVMALALAFALAGEARAQLVTEDAGVIPEDSPLARLTIRGSRWRHVDEVQAVGEFRLAFHERFEGAAFLPLIGRKFDLGSEHERIGGLGDVAIQGKVNILREDTAKHGIRAAVFGRIEFPTGEWDDTLEDSDVAYTRKLQLGSGTFDFRLGAAFSYSSGRHLVALDAWGQASTSRDDVSPGPIIRADAGYWFRLVPGDAAAEGSDLELRIGLEGWYFHRYHTRGEDLDDSADQVWVAPGVRFQVTKWLVLEASCGFNLADSADDEYGRAQVTGYVAGRINF